MQILPIQAIPNQEFTVTLDSNLWDITLQATNGIMAATLVLNGTTIVQGAACVAGQPLIASHYLENGNFIFITQSEQIPYYTQFNITQSLWYYSQAELAIFRAGNILLNPLGAAPLRFKPQGYTSA